MAKVTYTRKVVMSLLASSCWYWAKAPNKAGYGTHWVEGKVYRAHRFVYEALVGEIPEGLVLDHLCKNKLCVNPDHLEAVTQKVNMERGLHAQKTHCPHGHEYTPENTYLYDNRRTCKTCKHPTRVINGNDVVVK